MLTNLTSYHSKLVGVTFEGRQDMIAQLKGGEELRFRREPDNEYDSNAVAVDVRVLATDVSESSSDGWMPIGYIARDKNADLAAALDAGKGTSIKLEEITGGGDKAYGVNVYIELEKKRKLSRSSNAILEKDIFGNEIFYDDVAHVYTNALGEEYLSGSKYASQFEKAFDSRLISGKIAHKYGLSDDSASLIEQMWRLKALASTSFGTSIHVALELYGKYKELSESIASEVFLHDNPVIRRAVQSFYKLHPDVSSIKLEALVVDHSKKRAGRIDRLEYESEKEVWLTDYKTNASIEKSLDKYQRQLSFYAAILKANGVTTKGLKIYHYDGDWHTIELDVIDIDKEGYDSL